LPPETAAPVSPALKIVPNTPADVDPALLEPPPPVSNKTTGGTPQ
jgi:hypothetical protein